VSAERSVEVMFLQNVLLMLSCVADGEGAAGTRIPQSRTGGMAQEAHRTRPV
jgi:hypothetical protein